MTTPEPPKPTSATPETSSTQPSKQPDYASMQQEGPLLYDDLHRLVKEIQPMNFDGLRFTVNRPLSPNMQLSHSISMGLRHSAYKFGASYMGTKQISPIESYPVLAADIQGDGQMNANFIHMLNPRLKAKIFAAFARNQCAGCQSSLDYKGDKFTSTLTAANIDLINNNGIFVGQLLHQFSKALTIGPELVLQYGTQQDSFNAVSRLSLGGRFDANKYHVDATVTMGGAHISYFQRANESLKLGAELVVDGTVNQSNAGFYYQYDLNRAHTSFKGSIDTAWNVATIIEKRFAQFPIVLYMSAVLNHPKNSTTVGMGLTIGQG